MTNSFQVVLKLKFFDVMGYKQVFVGFFTLPYDLTKLYKDSVSYNKFSNSRFLNKLLNKYIIIFYKNNLQKYIFFLKGDI